jgi:hypothetical protein
MAYSVATSPFSNLNKLRLRTGDTDGTYTMFTDNELNALLTAQSNNIGRCTGLAFRALSCDPIRLAKMMNACSTITMRTLADQYAQWAQALLG